MLRQILLNGLIRVYHWRHSFTRLLMQRCTGDLNNSTNNTLEIIERICASVISRINKLAQSGKHKDAREFFAVDEQLSNIENYLQELVGTTNTNNLNEPFPKEIISNQTTESKPNYDSYKVDETESHNLDEDFTK